MIYLEFPVDEDYTEMMKKEISILSEIKNGPHCLRLHDNFLHESENGKHQIIVTNLCAVTDKGDNMNPQFFNHSLLSYIVN